MTFKNAERPKEVAKHVSMERLLVETDAPYLRHIRIEGSEIKKQARVTLVAEQIAKIKGLSYEEVCEQTTKNAEKLFNLNS
ncbi:TatD family hydrolase [Staphylococcus aureus]